MRFPRCEKIRFDDKTWDECLTFDELKYRYQNPAHRNKDRVAKGEQSLLASTLAIIEC